MTTKKPQAQPQPQPEPERRELEPGHIWAAPTTIEIDLAGLRLSMDAFSHPDLPGLVALTPQGLQALIAETGAIYVRAARQHGSALPMQMQLVGPVQMEIISQPPLAAEIVRDSAGRISGVLSD